MIRPIRMEDEEVMSTLKFLKAHMETNEEVMEDEDVTELQDMIDLFTVEKDFRGL